MISNNFANNRSLVLIYFIILIVPAIFYQTTVAMVEVWRVNETFTHGFLIFPISLWLIWEKRHNLSKLYPAPEPLAPIGIFLLLCLWLISALIDVKVIMQLSMVSIILTTLWSVLGRKIFFYLLFPFLYLYLSVPVGQSLIPVLMEFTANATVNLVKLTGIPIYQDGLYFVLPSGSWSVVEECSGVRYLIATLTLGIVYAYLTYSTLKKRLIFIAFCVFVPIIANSLRAFMIVMLGHFSDMELATGADHLLYGWVFFGIIIFTMFYIGSFWRDNKSDFDAPAPVSATHRINLRTASNMTTSLIVICLFQLFYHQLQTATEDVQHTTSQIPSIDQYGPWRRQSTNTSTWTPIIHRPDLALSDAYVSSLGAIQLDIGYFFRQREGSEAVSTNNRLVDPYGGDWKIVSSSVVDTAIFSVQETIIARSGRKLLIWQWYRMGELQTHSPYKAKLYEAFMRIFSGKTNGAFISLATPINDDKQEARDRLLSFFNQAIGDINIQLSDL